MKLRLNYLFPGQTIPVQSDIDGTGPFFNTWLQSMIDSVEADVIYFFTTDSTDIFED